MHCIKYHMSEANWCQRMSCFDGLCLAINCDGQMAETTKKNESCKVRYTVSLD